VHGDEIGMGELSGTLTALITPFRNGAVDEDALRELVEGQIVGKVDGLVPCGTTGESVNLSEAESSRVVRVVVEQSKGRVPVIAGAGSASTSHTIELAHAAQKAGASAILNVTPYYNRPTQEGLVAHTKALHDAIGLPIVLYNIPGRTGADMALETVQRCAELPRVVAIKEATGNVLRAQSIARVLGDRLTILSGDDALTIGIMAVGGHGVISVASNLVPDLVSESVRLMRAGDLVRARQQHQQLLPLYEALFVESNPGPAKAALAAMGKIASEIRLPLVWPTERTQTLMRDTLRGLGRL
jgi:4-hydroxy-tetrahydrodipicolinate synthase